MRMFFFLATSHLSTGDPNTAVAMLLTYKQLHEQVKFIGMNCVMADEFHLKYGHEVLLTRDSFFQYLCFC